MDLSLKNRKKWYTYGFLTPNTIKDHFFVVPKDEALKEQVSEGKFVLLSAHRQCGKSTRTLYLGQQFTHDFNVVWLVFFIIVRVVKLFLLGFRYKLVLAFKK